MNYEFGNKNNWRRAMWNSVKNRIKVHPRDAIVLYLAAEEDLDRRIAIEKGFCPKNLIAVENSPAVFRKLRAAGIPCIKGDIFEVAAAWPERPRVDVVIADLCCGMDKKIHEHYLPLAGTCEYLLVLNLLRGRDKTGEIARAAARSFRGNLESAGLMDLELFKDYPESFKHRGACVHSLMVVQAAAALEKRELSPVHFVAILSAYNARFISYRSSRNQTFDTVVMHPSYKPLLEPPDQLRLNSLRAKVYGECMPELRASISAVLAHRTRGTYELAGV